MDDDGLNMRNWGYYEPSFKEHIGLQLMSAMGDNRDLKPFGSSQESPIMVNPNVLTYHHPHTQVVSNPPVPMNYMPDGWIQRERPIHMLPRKPNFSVVPSTSMHMVPPLDLCKDPVMNMSVEDNVVVGKDSDVSGMCEKGTSNLLPFTKELPPMDILNFRYWLCKKCLQNNEDANTLNDDEVDYIFNIPTLTRLKLAWLNGGNRINKLVLLTPNLEYLFVGGVLFSLFVMKDVMSLVEASVSFRDIKSYHLWFELLKGINGVKSLSVRLNERSLDCFKIPLASSLPIFPNMKHLELKGFWHPLLIAQFLQSSPELKHLSIGKVSEHFFMNPKEFCWVEPNVIPSCMLTNLTSIKYSVCKWEKINMEFLDYMLGNAEVCFHLLQGHALNEILMEQHFYPLERALQVSQNLTRRRRR